MDVVGVIAYTSNGSSGELGAHQKGVLFESRTKLDVARQSPAGSGAVGGPLGRFAQCYRELKPA